MYPIFTGVENIAFGAIAGLANGVLSLPQSYANGNFNGLVNNAKSYDASAFVTTAQWIGPASPVWGMMFFDPAGAWVQNGPMFGVAHVLSGASNVTGFIFNSATRLLVAQDMFSIGFAWATLIANVLYNQCPDFTTGTVFGLFDLNNNAVGAVPRTMCQYRPQNFTGSPPPPLQTYTPNFDDAVLNDIWNGVSGIAGASYTLDIFKGGWIVKFVTKGHGPTGQAVEVALCDPSMATYYLLRFIAQDVGAFTQLGRANVFTWQAKPDPNGVLYFNSGNGPDSQQILYSYSPTLFGAPQFSYTPQRYSLPCYTVCSSLAPVLGN